MRVSHQFTLPDSSTEPPTFYLTIASVVYAILAFVLLLLPSVITHSIRLLILVLAPAFLFALVQLPRFQWPPKRLDVTSSEVFSHLVSLFRRPPPQSR
jgi:hypothetical protein